MVTLRLARAGAKKAPFYRLVVADSRNPRDGRFLEHVGVVDPTRSPIEIKIDFDRVNHWLQRARSRLKPWRSCSSAPSNLPPNLKGT